ncbi:MAG: glycosyltransferase family 2 protein [Paludibacteraceae bacterium]|nr:glycosyltransferase family 2 protein [Paludibacteraceae bacterium]
MNNPIVSIILVNYNTCKITCNCIESIIANVKSVEYEIIVVDNASKDESVETFKQLYPNIKIIQSTTNLGFGRANNLAAKSAIGEYLFLLNTDTVLQNDPFPYFISFYTSHDCAGAIGTHLVNAENRHCLSGGSIYSKRKYLKRFFLRLLGKNKFNTVPTEGTVEVGYIIGADMFIKTELFYQLNGFDENIFMYFEDGELCKRILNLGLKNYLIDGPQIIHLENGSTPSMFYRIYNMASLMYVIRKTTNPILFFIFQICLFIIRIPILFMPQNSFNERLEWLFAIFKYKNYLNQ